MPGTENIPVLKPEIPILSPSNPQPKADETARRLYESVSPALLQIRTDHGAGTGFFINGNGDAVTAAHVVMGTHEIYAITPDGTRYQARIEKLDDIKDVAQIHVEGIASTQALDLGDSGKLKADEPIYALGYPLGLRPQYISPGYYRRSETTRDIVAEAPAERRKAIDDMLKKMTPNERQDADQDLARRLLDGRVHVEKGNSGGPLVNADGKVVGMSDMLDLTQGDSRSFYNPVEDIKSLLANPSKFEFSYARQPDAWARGVEYEFANHTGPSILATGAVGTGLGYVGYRLASRFPTVPGLLVGTYSLSHLLDDVDGLGTSSNGAETTKYGLKVAADLTTLAGAAASLFPQTRTLGYIGMGLGLAGNAGASFIPTHLVMTDMRRTTGGDRPPYPPDYILTKPH